MLTHSQIWSAIDSLAERNRLTASGLARRAGLDPTSFNKSKRFTPNGRQRWPSTESLAKALRATGTTVGDFFSIIDDGALERLPVPRSYRQPAGRSQVPLIGFAQAGVGGFFDDGGFPVGQGWEEIALPANSSETAYALKVSGDSMLPLYREGDVIIVDPAASIRQGDRVVAKSRNGEVMAKLLEKRSSSQIILASLNPEHAERSFAPDEIEWIARIVWASQ